MDGNHHCSVGSNQPCICFMAYATLHKCSARQSRLCTSPRIHLRQIQKVSEGLAHAGAELPEGFQATVHLRKESSSPGAVDIYYFDHQHSRYRSKLQVKPLKYPHHAMEGSRASCPAVQPARCWRQAILSCRVHVLLLRPVVPCAADCLASIACLQFACRLGSMAQSPHQLRHMACLSNIFC